MGTRTNNTRYRWLLPIAFGGGLAAAGCAAKTDVVKPVEEIPMDDAAFLRAGESRAPEARAVVERATKKGKTVPKSKAKGSDPYFRYSERFGKDPPPVEPPVAVASPASSASTVNVALQPAAVPSSQPTLPVVASRPSVTPAPAVSLPPPAAPSAAPNVRVAASAPAPAEPPPIATAPVIPVKPVVPELKPVTPTVPEKVEKTDTIDSWEKVAGAKLGESQATAGKLRATEK
ncbi:MAG: hypothetical protein KBF88_04105, partial [Polyangiaceae bacterium]|nr:hypothetical protein [Polyangiaceae bacterium]